jgi:hypothetical protein
MHATRLISGESTFADTTCRMQIFLDERPALASGWYAEKSRATVVGDEDPRAGIHLSA